MVRIISRGMQRKSGRVAGETPTTLLSYAHIFLKAAKKLGGLTPQSKAKIAAMARELLLLALLLTCGAVSANLVGSGTGSGLQPETCSGQEFLVAATCMSGCTIPFFVLCRWPVRGLCWELHVLSRKLQ